MEEEIGKVFLFFAKPGVAAVKLDGVLKIGDRIRITGATTDFEQIVTSLQINNKQVEEAGPGDDVGIKVNDKVRQNDRIYLIEE